MHWIRRSRKTPFAISSELEAEIVRVLTERFFWTEEKVRGVLKAALGRAMRVQLRGTVMGCRDPKDDMFLECAWRAKADLLVAGDKDLLVMESCKGTKIVTPKEYVGG